MLVNPGNHYLGRNSERTLPGDFPPWQTVYTYERQWRKNGTWLQIHDRLRGWTRIDIERHPSPSEAVIDSQSVKSAAFGSQSVGYDAGKQIKGRKRFMTVDTLGLVLRVLVTAANVPEREGAKQVFKQVLLMSNAVSRLHTIWADGGFDGNPSVIAKIPLRLPFGKVAVPFWQLLMASIRVSDRETLFTTFRSNNYWLARIYGMVRFLPYLLISVVCLQ